MAMGHVYAVFSASLSSLYSTWSQAEPYDSFAPLCIYVYRLIFQSSSMLQKHGRSSPGVRLALALEICNHSTSLYSFTIAESVKVNEA